MAEENVNQNGNGSTGTEDGTPSVNVGSQNQNLPPDEVQKIKSWLGRVEAGSKDTAKQMGEFKSMLQQITDRLDRGSQQFSSSGPPSTFDEELHAMVLGGQVTEAFDRYSSMKTEADQRLQNLKDQKMKDAMTAINIGESQWLRGKDKEIESGARQLIGRGIDPTIAVQTVAREMENQGMKAVFNQLVKESPDRFEMLGQGSGQGTPSSKGKLPPEYEEACQTGIKKGTFKDRDEYISFMSPRIRAKLGV